MIFKNNSLASQVSSSTQMPLDPIRATSEKEKEDETWIEGESIRAFMPTQQQTQIIAMFVIPIVFSVLYGQVNMLGLILWAIASMLLAIYRWRLTVYYTNFLSMSDTSAQLQFKAKNAWTWPSTSLLWSMLIWLFFSKAPLFNQFVCFVILASIGVFSATGYAPHSKTMKLFINTMMISLLCGMYGTMQQTLKPRKLLCFTRYFPCKLFSGNYFY